MGTPPGHLPEDHYSFEDYLALEERSELRHELVGGRVILMSGGTRAHDQAMFYLAQRLSDASRSTSRRPAPGRGASSARG